MRPSPRPSGCGARQLHRCHTQEASHVRKAYAVCKMRMNEGKHMNSDECLGTFKGMEREILEDFIKGIILWKERGVGHEDGRGNR